MNWPPTSDDIYRQICDYYQQLNRPIPTREWYDASIANRPLPRRRSDIQADYDYHRREMGD